MPLLNLGGHIKVQSLSLTSSCADSEDFADLRRKKDSSEKKLPRPEQYFYLFHLILLVHICQLKLFLDNIITEDVPLVSSTMENYCGQYRDKCNSSNDRAKHYAKSVVPCAKSGLKM